MKHLGDVHVARDHPRVEVGVPVYGVLVAQPAIQRVRVGQYIGVKEVIQTEG
jgi:hypothetical protein